MSPNSSVVSMSQRGKTVSPEDRNRGNKINASEITYQAEEDDTPIEFIEVEENDIDDVAPKRQSAHMKLWNKMSLRKKGRGGAGVRMLSTQYDMQTEINYDLLSRSESMKRMNTR